MNRLSTPLTDATPPFPAYKIAVISTAHITERDSNLLQTEECPTRLFQDDYSWVLHIDQSYSTNRNLRAVAARCHRENLKQLRAFGFSEAFLKLYNLAHKQRFHYLKLDCDGDEIDGLQTFEW